jgi:hypothetical protein
LTIAVTVLITWRRLVVRLAKTKIKRGSAP